jgi:predicted RNase H-like nuclease
MPKSNAKMKAASHQDLLAILKENGAPMTPEQLFHVAGFKPSQVDQFYLALASVRDKVRELKPETSEAKSWPLRAKVLLQLGKGAKK